MKFITNRPGAPDIPLDLQEAQETDRLILFCGAGISYPAGLPGFENLVKSVYETLPAQKSSHEEDACNHGLYDRVLHLLEQRTSPKLVRRAIIERLSINSGADLATHKAILELAKTQSGYYRLVTTNVDHGFLETGVTCKSHAAPFLPIPKPYKWHGVTYLHGIIDTDNDPDGEQLIFTSGDFGSAYLTERWASRFITELFRHFTILFIGYSLNDPVLRYMTDAIAAERNKGY